MLSGCFCFEQAPDILRGTDAISGKDAFLSEAVNLLREITDERRKTEVLAHLKVMVEYSE